MEFPFELAMIKVWKTFLFISLVIAIKPKETKRPNPTTCAIEVSLNVNSLGISVTRGDNIYKRLKFTNWILDDSKVNVQILFFVL